MHNPKIARLGFRILIRQEYYPCAACNPPFAAGPTCRRLRYFAWPGGADSREATHHGASRSLGARAHLTPPTQCHIFNLGP